MRKTKSPNQLPLIIFDKCVPEDYAYYEEKKVQQTDVILDEPVMTLEDLLRRLISIFEKPLFALKHHIYNVLDFLKTRVSIPWFKLVLIALAVFVLAKKDMQFNVSFKAPLSVTTDEDQRAGANVINASNPNKNSLAPAGLSELKKTKTKSFIQEYKNIAIEEMEATGVPASIKMAQAIVESRSGTSRLAVQSNNFFGIKCRTKCLGCTCRNYADDDKYDMFRVFASPIESWKEHSKLLSIERYSKLKKHGNDYKAWAKGLKKAGYATDSKYDKKLINIIESYKLYKLDK